MTLTRNVNSFLVALLALFMIGNTWASENTSAPAHEEHGGQAHSEATGEHAAHEEEAFNVGKMIMEHVNDAHEYHLWGDHDHPTSIYLPIILMDGGMKIFSSSHFYHGEHKHSIDAKSGKPEAYLAGVGPAAGYALYHEKIYKLNNGELQIANGVASNDKPSDFSVTRNVVALFLSLAVVLFLMLGAARFYKSNGAVAPKGLAAWMEPLILFVRDDIAKENIGEAKYRKYLPYLLTIFFFILVSNLLGSIPLIGSNLTGNITVTLFLAVCTLLLTVFSANKSYWSHIFATPGVPIALLPIMIPIEIVGIFTKPFALMVRLFANITAGHIIILALISIIFINKSMAWGALSVPMALFISVLELLVAFLQAYLFAMLSALFIGAAVADDHH